MIYKNNNINEVIHARKRLILLASPNIAYYIT
jgi:hypothetical protein